MAVADDEGVRALYAPRESTSVWRAEAEADTAVVATLAQMSPPGGGTLTIPERDYTAQEILDPARYKQSGVVQIQIVKRNGEFVPVVDGLRPPEQEETGGKVVHLINHHRGMHEDLDTKTWVFSPCAVTMCIEDGQSFPERCTVSVWQHVSIANTTSLTSPTDPIQLGERQVTPFAVSDYTTSAVYVPMPTRHSQQPRVILTDLSAVLRFKKHQDNKALWHFLSTSVQYFGILFIKANIEDTPSDTAKKLANVGWLDAWFDSANEWLFPKTPEEVAEEATSFFNLTALFGSWASSPPRPPPTTPPPPQNDGGTGIEWKVHFMKNAPSLMAAAGYIAIRLGIPAAAAVTFDWEETIEGAINGKNSVGTQVADEFWPFMRELNVRLFDRGKLLGYMCTAMKGYIEQPLWPEPIKRHFTIGELASVVESLGSLLPATNDQLLSGTGKRNFASEAVVLQWLVAADTNLSFIKAAFKGDLASLAQGGGLPNKIDMSEFGALSKAAIELRVHIDIEDPTSRMGCNGEDAHFEFTTSRQDKDYTGFAAAGLAHDIRRLQAAIVRFDKVLRDESEKSTWSDEYNTFVDRWIYRPLFTLVMQSFKHQQRQNSESQVKGYDGEVLLLLQRYRSFTFKYIRKHIDAKLKARFIYPNSEGEVLLRKINQATRDRFLKKQTVPEYLRELPQKLQQPTFLFPLTKHAESNYVDVEIESGTMREFSPLHDAVIAGARAAQSAMTAIGRMHRKWETEGQRTIFVHAVEGTNKEWWKTGKLVHTLLPTQEAYSLVLHLPGDIRSAEATTRLEEKTERRILTLCHRGAAATAAGTLLDKVKLPDTEAALVAMSLFAELWTDELVKLHARPEPTLRVLSAVQTAQARAASRCLACGRLVEATTVQTWSGFLPMAGDDPALLATQAGRDAARLGRRLQLAAQPVTSRGVLSRAMVQRVRDIGKALIVTGNRLATKPDAQVLPSEPLQALFMRPEHGIHAFARVQAFAKLDHRVVAAVAAAYPSSLLLADADALSGAGHDSGNLLEPVAPLKSSPVLDDVKRKMRQRMAALRFDFDDMVHMDDYYIDELHESGEELTNAMSSLSVTNGTHKAAAYYVPYGYGHAPPRLVYPPVSAPMFGSVPVWTSHVIESIDLLRKTMKGDASDLPKVVIRPTFPCEASLLNTTTHAPPPEHPALIEVVQVGERVDLRFWASEPELNVTPQIEVPAAFRGARDAAQQHVQSDYARKLASRVSTLAWNAERILQCLIAIIGQGDPTVAGADVGLMLGNGDARVAVHRRGESNSRRLERLKREVEEAHYNAESSADLHFTELRRLMSRIEGYIEDPARFVLTPNNANADGNGDGDADGDSDGDAGGDAGGDADNDGDADGAPTVAAPVSDSDMSHIVFDGNLGGLAHYEESDTQVSMPTPVALARAIGVVQALQVGLSFISWLNPALAAANAAYIAGTLGALGTTRLLYKQRQRMQTINQAKELYGSKSTLGLSNVKASNADCELPFARSEPKDRYNADEWKNRWTTGDAKIITDNRKVYVAELAQLRNPNISTVKELRKEDCPTGENEPEAWELWRKDAEDIEGRCLMTFLDDDYLAMNLSNAAPHFDPDEKFTPNPDAVTRKEVYKKIVEAYAISDTAAEYTGGEFNAELLYYRSLLAINAGLYYDSKEALKAHEEDVKREQEMRAAMHRHVRMHAVAAAVVGAALTRGVLGDGAPKLTSLLGPVSVNALDMDERNVVLETLQKMHTRFEFPNDATSADNVNRPAALRLGELCAIIQSLLE